MKEWNYEGKVFLVTGASSGIGRSCVEQLLNSGANVVGIDAKDSDLKDPLYMHYEVSVTDDSEIQRVVRVEICRESNDPEEAGQDRQYQLPAGRDLPE